MPRRKLTDQFVRRVEPDQTRRLHFQDAVQEGLVLQVEPLNDRQRTAGRAPHRTYIVGIVCRYGRFAIRTSD